MKINKMIALSIIILSSVILGYLINDINKNSNNYINNNSIDTKFFLRNDIQDFSFKNNMKCANNIINNDTNKYQILDGIGNSMDPTIMDGQLAICDNDIKDYKKGMIILVDEINVSYIHRIKAIYPNYIITQGDNNINEDNIINKSQIECVVIGVCY